MTGTDVLKESIRCQFTHCKEEAMADEIARLRAERDDARRDAARLLDELTTTKWQRDQHEKDAMKLIRVQAELRHGIKP